MLHLRKECADGWRRLPRAAQTGFRACSRLTVVVLSALALAGFAAGTARAQDNLTFDSYINPFPKGDVYNVRVVGDSLAAGLQWVLPESLGNDARVRLDPKRWTFKRVTTQYFEREIDELRRDIYKDNVHVVIMMVGAWDRRSLRTRKGEWVKQRSDAWRAEYSERIGELMKTLRRANVAVYWVGLPPFAKRTSNETIQAMNEIIRERAYLNGVKFIDAYSSFIGDDGRYSAYGPDLTGKVRLLRYRDGIHFSGAGNRKLAHYIERAVKRDLDIARKERSVPLDGDEEDQAAVGPSAKAAPAKRPLLDWALGTSTTTPEAPGAAEQGASAAESSDRGFFAQASGEQPAENSRVNLATLDAQGREQIISVEIVRPAIPASVVALVTRKQRKDRLSPMGDTLVDEITGGISIMSSVTPANEYSGQRLNRKLSPAQSPFFRVLVKGERLEPRSGRADDIVWRPPPASDPKALSELARKVQPARNDFSGPAIPDPLERVSGVRRSKGGIPLPELNPLRQRGPRA